MWDWSLIEYRHISRIVGKENLWFTHVIHGAGKVEKYGKVITDSIAELDVKNACVLDPEAEKTLTPEEAKNFDYFIFGGILGDYPPRKRTKVELTSKMRNVAVRNIGKEQMSTDNAVYVIKKIVGGVELADLKFQDEIEIPLGPNESTILPYRYVLVNGKPFISDDLLRYLREKKGF